MRKGLLVVVGLSLAACAVRDSNPDRITIEHLARQPLPAQQQAQRHCARSGRKAVLESESAVAPSGSFLLFRSQTSTFVCVDE